MKYKSNSRRKPAEYEKDLVNYWKKNRIFEMSIEQRPADNSYVFYDGPPFITGEPHHGTLLSSIVKDAVPRFWTMKGKRVERVWGWDCHGLPAEVFTEKKLGIKDKKEIGSKISLEDYIKACRENMVQTGNLWEETIERVGRWVDFKGAYKTMDKEYMESIWWAFKELYDKGKIYEGEKVLMYCIKDATPVSKAEVAMDNSYQDVTDPSVYVKFKLNDSDSYLLAWTTTPWTLNANTAVVVNKNLDYVEVELDGEKFILAEELVDKALTNEKHEILAYKILRKFKGSELVGKEYEPLFEHRGENAHKIWHGGFVHADEGTGVAHEAPAYGEDDYELSRENNVPIILDTDEEGYYTSGEWKGRQVWEANKEIAKTLHERGIVWKIDYITHSYPHCWRCGTKLMYRAHPSWFMDVSGQRQEMLEQNQGIRWFPSHIKHGRFEKTIESAPDWNLSRDRFWATAMPVWKGKDKSGKEHVKVIGSYQELKELSGAELEDYHRPWIDDVTFTINNVKYQRIDKVIDGWFESGSMPFAQFHYPFENKDKFKQSFPGDFIAEYVAQTRTWFYYLHAIGVGLFGKNAFNNVVVTGTLAGNDGRKMSKSFGNYTDPNKLIDTYSADAYRFLLLSSPLLSGEDFALTDKDVADISRKLAMVWNMYDFFTLYAEVDGWEWKGNLDDPSDGLTNSLDLWIVSKTHQLISHVERNMEDYNLPHAMSAILPFIDDASNWYVRRSRKRFWKSEDDSDKQNAYKTLHYVLIKLSIILAPFTPFMADELYRNLTGEESVHLLDWPSKGQVDEDLVQKMDSARNTVTIGLSLRAKAGIKVRQPLSSVTLSASKVDLSGEFTDIIKEELNIKQVLIDDKVVKPEKSFKENLNEQNFAQLETVKLDTKITPDLKKEGIARELIRHIQSARKEAGFNVDDRIYMELKSDSKDINEAYRAHKKLIHQEVLAIDKPNKKFSFTKSVKIEDSPAEFSLQKAK